MLKVPAILTSMSKTHDKGLRLGFVTNEMPLVDQVEAMALHDTFGYLIFNPNPVSESDIPKEAAEDKTKTPSKRLRSVLFLLFKQTSGPEEDFEVWYRKHMEMLIDQIKSKLDR